jgi:nucleoside-diphosphate-sugar epimerase
MKILVTGGIGKVGGPVVARLTRHGHQVTVLDRRATQENPDIRCVDITDFAALSEQVRGHDAIVHLAALPAPGIAPGPETFRINCTGTFNVFEAAAIAGIHRVVCASSINALGFNFGIKTFGIQYFPIDEEHPGFTTDPYSFSKQITEEIAAYYWRREGISSVCLRMPMVLSFGGQSHRMWQAAYPFYRRAYAMLLALPKAEQVERARHITEDCSAWRAGRPAEKPHEKFIVPDEPPSDLFQLLPFGYSDFWTILSGEDAAQAFEKGLLADYEGSHPLYINESQNLAGVESETLARLFFPEATTRRRPLVGTEALVSIEKARLLIGFEPEAPVSQLLEADHEA